MADQSLREDGRGRTEAGRRDEERWVERDDDMRPGRRARKVEDDATGHVRLQSGEERTRGEGAVRRCTNKNGGGATLVERPVERGVWEADVVPVKPGNGHRCLVGGLRQDGELVKAGR